ncbi:hypothetical protein TruAng_004333 [Truncatella angustata]|nr:hypothetical protein TruAng_004333 [Truncatella angustata]
MAPVSVVPEQGPLLLDISDEHYNDVLGETIEEEDVSGSQLPDATVSSDSSRVLIQICIVTLLFDFTQYSVYAPLTEVFEEIICNNFYPAGSLQRDCIVLGIPLGLLADRIGRKPLILLFLLGIFLSDTWVKIVTLFPNQLPLRLVWLAPILKAVGGGANFGTSMFYTAVADIVEEKRRINAWYPLGLSSVLLVVAGLLAMALPETHPQHRRASLELPDPVQAQASVSGNNEETQQLDSHLETVRKLMPRAYASSADLLKNPGIILSLAVFLLAAFGAHVWALLLHLPIYQSFTLLANLLFSLRGAITLLLSLIIMGAIDKFMQQKLGIKSAQKDLWLCTGSCILIAVGVAVVGVSQSPILMVAGVVVSALGSSLLVSLRSAMISLFPHTPMASLNAVAGMAQSLGILISGPVLAATYSWGLSQGGIWVGAPFLLASGLHFIALADIFYLRLTRAPSQVVIAHESSEA